MSAVFVDYDNIYLSLKRRNEDAAKRFAKDAAVWIKAIEQGSLITPTNGPGLERPRRIVMNRCYGNPVPRRNSGDNSTDMSSFPFVRHHFLRAGFEITDCPPLTAQLKNSSDIKMVMDVRDFLTHDTYFEEFIIMSGDADFTPVLHRLRSHARRTIIFANDYTAAPYTAICDGEIRESSLVELLLAGRQSLETVSAAAKAGTNDIDAATADSSDVRSEIMGVVLDSIESSNGPVPIEALADKAVRQLGTEKTSATNWGGSGSFRSFLSHNLPNGVRLTENAPYFAFDTTRHGSPEADAKPVQTPASQPLAPMRAAPSRPAVAQTAPLKPAAEMASEGLPAVIGAPSSPMAAAAPKIAPGPTEQQRAEAQRAANQAAIQRIFEACQAPMLPPDEYRKLFDLMALELTENKLSGAQTITNVLQRALEAKLRVGRDDVRFVFDVVSEVDPWFEQGASAQLFAGRFRNFVVARCRSQGMNLSGEDVDLIDRLFASSATARPASQNAASPDAPQEKWWPATGPAAGQQAHSLEADLDASPMPAEDFPRIVRSRMRG